MVKLSKDDILNKIESLKLELDKAEDEDTFRSVEDKIYSYSVLLDALEPEDEDDDHSCLDPMDQDDSADFCEQALDFDNDLNREFY